MLTWGWVVISLSAGSEDGTQGLVRAWEVSVQSLSCVPSPGINY